MYICQDFEFYLKKKIHILDNSEAQTHNDDKHSRQTPLETADYFGHYERHGGRLARPVHRLVFGLIKQKKFI